MPFFRKSVIQALANQAIEQKSSRCALRRILPKSAVSENFNQGQGKEEPGNGPLMLKSK
jgi:hypothetical protein